MSIINIRKHAPRWPRHSSGRAEEFRAVSAFAHLIVVLLTLGVSPLARADDSGRCPPISTPNLDAVSAQADLEQDIFRRKAAAFAPDLIVRFWYHQRTQAKVRSRTHAIAQVARPDQTLSVARDPFGWEVSASWNLVDIADTLLPDRETPLRIYASDCAAFERSSESRVNLGVDDDPDGAIRLGVDSLEQGDLQ